jgi:type II secretion system protein E
MLKKLLGQILIDAGLMEPETLEIALVRAQRNKERIGEALIAQRAVTREDVHRALAIQAEVPYLTREEIPSTLPVIKNLSPRYLQEYICCPIAVEGSTVTVATADPTNPVLLDDLRQSLGAGIRLCVAPPEAILEAIERTYGAGASTALQKIVEGIGGTDGGLSDEEDVTHLRDMAFEAPVVRLTNLLIEEAMTAEASDIHIEPFEDTLRVRYRIDGILYDQESPPRRLQAALTSRIKLMADMNIAERRLPQDGRIRVTIHNRRVDIRVSTVPTVHGESIVMRLLDRSTVFLPLENLGLGADLEKLFARLIHMPHGIVLVTGPTGSGKTTTLYASLDKINGPDKKIITVEDPVEYQLKGVNQIPVRPGIGLTFASGLRSIVRQDPDVIMVGEIRDLETAEIAIQAALTGHLVFSTLHTNDAPGAITRLEDMGAEPYLLSSVIEGVVAQRLVRRICARCRVPHEPQASDLLALGIQESVAGLHRGAGCDACRGTGYRGRTGIYELLTVTEDVRSMILRRASAGEIRRHAMERGQLRTLREDGWAKTMAGVTTVEELLRVIQEDS